MGVCYYLIKLDKNEFYDLGKNFLPFPPDLDYRKPFVLSEVTNDNMLYYDALRATTSGWSFPNEANRSDYCLKIAKDIFKWAGSDRVIVLSDSSDAFNELRMLDEWIYREYRMKSDASKPYQETGTRYQE